MKPLEVDVPARTRGQVLRGLPGRIRPGARRDGKLSDDIWALASSRRFEQELDEAVLLDRRLRPFDDPELFPHDVDLGPFEVYRGAEVRERAGVSPGPSFVEPNFGWVITSSGRLVRRGVIDRHTLAAPSVRGFIRARTRGGRTASTATLVNLRDRAEGTYAHVMLELVGGRLRLADECGLQDVPVLISRGLSEQPFFQAVVRRAGFSGRNFVVQDDQYVRTEEVFIFDTSPYARASIEYLQRILSVPEADPSSARRLFVVRKPDRRTGRGVTNMDQVADVCHRFGFDLTANDDMPLEDQMELFSSARVVAGVHGSGLFNIAFRKGAELTLVEILPPGADLSTPRAWWFYEAAVLGHEHVLMPLEHLSDGVIGKPAYRRDFAIDPEHLAATLGSVVERI